jgi:hypothetical protein
MSRFTATLIFILLAVGTAVAAETPKLEVKNKSSFTMDGNSRNPFWPIGWKPAVRSGSDDHVDPRVPASVFLVSSIAMEDEQHFAIINGQIMQEGQEFGLQMSGQTYRIKVKSIEDGKVILAQRDQEIVVTLRRK